MVNRLDTIKPARPGEASREFGTLAMSPGGEDVSRFRTKQFTVVRPVRRVNVDLTRGMLRELDERAARLNVSRQAVIKTLFRQTLDRSAPQRRASKPQAG